MNIPSNKDEHGKPPNFIHSTMLNKVDYRIKNINNFLKKSVSLEVYNKKSLKKSSNYLNFNQYLKFCLGLFIYINILNMKNMFHRQR